MHVEFYINLWWADISRTSAIPMQEGELIGTRSSSKKGIASIAIMQGSLNKNGVCDEKGKEHGLV